MEYKETLKQLRALKINDEIMAEDIINVFAEIMPKASAFFKRMKTTINNKDDKIASLTRKISNFENKTVEPIVVEKVRAERTTNKKATDQSLRIAQMKQAAAVPAVEPAEQPAPAEEPAAVPAEELVKKTSKKKVSNEVEI